MERYTEDALMSDMILCLRELDSRAQPNTCRVLAKLATDYTKQLADAQATVEALQWERDQWREAFERSCADAAHLKAALDAERAIVARLEEEYAEKCVAKDNYITTLIEAKNKVSSKLTQLQALVRALPNLEHFDVGVDDHGGEIRLPDGYILFTATSRNRTYALEKLLKYRATLDATTPAATIGEQCSYCQKPLTTNHSFSYGFPGVPRVYKCDRTECIKPKGGDGE